MKSIIGANSFPNPKPSKLLSYLIGLFTDKNCQVLDFFAGSGTTLHGVLALNEKDSGRRRCILCTNNESGICDKITYPRVQNVIKGYVSQGNQVVELLRERLTLTKLRRADHLLEEAKFVRESNATKFTSIKAEVKDGDLLVVGARKEHEKVPPLGGSLKYYRTAFVGKHCYAEALDEDRAVLAAKAGALLALAEETLEEIPLAAKKAKLWQHFTDGAHRHTLIYFSDDLAGFASLAQTADAIRAKDAAARLTVYVYATGSVDAFENEFDDLSRISLKPIPEPILEIYKAINAR